MNPAYAELLGTLREAATLSAVAHHLEWDQETMMPARAAAFRADELALVARLAHERATDPRIGELLERCAADAALGDDESVAANLREIRRDYTRALKLPSALVAELSATASRALQAWKDARARNDFPAFRPWLERLFDLARRKAACYGTPPGGEPYDALLQDFEHETTSLELEQLFAPLRERLVGLIAELTAAPRRPDPGVLAVKLPIDAQQAFNRRVLQQIGFDLESGRIDVSVHPFSTGLGPGDTRLTTRYRDDAFANSLSSTLHEAGHGLYEQGLPLEHFGQPLGQTLGLGVHESQSRLWENHVGLSHAFWEWVLPEARRHFGGPLERLGLEEAYRAVNAVQPGWIRVEADEATYNLHVMLRFDLERALLRGDLAVADLPAAWNSRIRSDLGLEVPDDRHGCLQDIHWALGSIGYFPTYTLGTVTAAQLWEALVRDVPDVHERMARGDFVELLGWLRRNVHAHGRRYRTAELIRRLTGRPLGHDALLRHLQSKLRPIYAA
ncbi:MAG TPA: carboxypeptidase M32 [Candidatus Polarisedimenticolaceae bacterium]|nr:carboxypeptidase M32 [Candidatus Polarisedimenticolaceae bacterium]